MKDSLRVRIDAVIRKPDGMLIRGWTAADGPVTIRVCGRNGGEIPCTIDRHRRRDIETYLGLAEAARDSGFLIEVSPLPVSPVRVVFEGGGAVKEQVFHTSSAGALFDTAARKAAGAYGFLMRNGAASFLRKSKGKITHTETKAEPYPVWLKRHLPGEEELHAQRSEAQTGPSMCVLRVRDGAAAADTYGHEILSAQTWRPSQEAFLDLPLEDDAPSFPYEYIVLMRDGDIPAPSALYEIAHAIQGRPDTDIFYTDDDRVDDAGRHSLPRLKPEMAPDYYYVYPYIGTFLAIRSGIFETVPREVFCETAPEAFFFALILRCIEMNARIRRIPRILYHVRKEEILPFADRKRLAEAHFRRIGLAAELKEGRTPQSARVACSLAEQPKVSVLIPNKDHLEDLEKCVGSLLARTSYENYEILIIENNSTDPETFAGYDRLLALDRRIRLIRFEGGFNFSAINNLGVREAKGEVLFLLNNDTELIGDVIPEMLGFALRKEVGAVGALLYYPDDTVQHAGIVLGWGGACGHAFPGEKRGTPGYMDRITAQQDVSAVTAAAVMLRREVYEAVGGLDEAFAVALNDMDLCMKIRAAGWRIIYDPEAELYHYESRSRGSDDTREKRLLWEKEYDLFLTRWEDVIAEGDPYYNPNLSLTAQDFSLRPFTLE